MPGERGVNGARRLLTGWGRTAPTAATVVAPDTVDDVDDVLEHRRQARA